MTATNQILIKLTSEEVLLAVQKWLADQLPNLPPQYSIVGDLTEEGMPDEFVFTVTEEMVPYVSAQPPMLPAEDDDIPF